MKENSQLHQPESLESVSARMNCVHRTRGGKTVTMLWWLALVCNVTLARDVTFYHISDVHYGAKAFDRSVLIHTIEAMNSLPGTAYPQEIGGAVGMPRGVIITGDLTDGGQKIQWDEFAADWGLSGRDGLLKFPLYEGAGNHDGPVSIRTDGYGFVRRQIIQRNNARVGIVNRSMNGLHYSYDWDDVHFVCLNEYAGWEADQRYPGNPSFNRKQQSYGNPAEQSLQFLEQDLATQVGHTGRPVILTQHYGFDGFSFHPWGEKASWWTEEQALRLWEVIEGYNVIAVLSGHDGSEASIEWHGILNQHMDDFVRFGVYHITDNEITVAKRNSATGIWETSQKQSAHVNSALPKELRQGPYMVYPDEPDKMTIAWRCDTNITCRLRWGDDMFSYEDGSVEVEPYDLVNHLYRYTLTGLKEDTGINYALEINGKYAPGLFYTPPAGGGGTSKVKFMAIDDSVTAPPETERLYKAMYDQIYTDAAYHTFLLHVGRFVEGSSDLAEWDSRCFSRQPEFKHVRYVQSRLPQMGGIGGGDNELMKELLPYHSQEGESYAFDYGPVHIAMLNSDQDWSTNGAAYRWLATDLATTTNTWKILVYGESLALHAKKHLMLPFCESYGVDVCLIRSRSGYSRSMVGGTCCVALGAERAATDRAGLMSDAAELSALHFYTFTVEPETLAFRVMQTDGKVMDQFSMKDFRGNYRMRDLR